LGSDAMPPFLLVHATQLAPCATCGADVVIPARDDQREPVTVTCIPCALGRGDS